MSGMLAVATSRRQSLGPGDTIPGSPFASGSFSPFRPGYGGGLGLEEGADDEALSEFAEDLAHEEHHRWVGCGGDAEVLRLERGVHDGQQHRWVGGMWRLAVLGPISSSTARRVGLLREHTYAKNGPVSFPGLVVRG